VNTARLVTPNARVHRRFSRAAREPSEWNALLGLKLSALISYEPSLTIAEDLLAAANDCARFERPRFLFRNGTEYSIQIPVKYLGLNGAPAGGPLI
jgi:hypothetical protein